MEHNSQNTRQKKIRLINTDNAIVRNYFFHYVSQEPESLMLLQRGVRGEMNQMKTSHSAVYICRIQLSLTVTKAEL